MVRLEAALQLSSIQKVVSSSGRVGGSLRRKGCVKLASLVVDSNAEVFACPVVHDASSCAITNYTALLNIFCVLNPHRSDIVSNTVIPVS